MKRGEIESAFAEHMVEGMDWETLSVFAIEQLRKEYEQLSDDELETELRDYAPHLLED